jgi:thioredoxin 1
VLLPFPKSMATRLTDGKFSVSVEDRPRVSVFATDKRRERGGFVSVEKRAADTPVTITLRPLSRVHGKVYCPEAGRVPDWTMAIVHPPGDRENYLHFTHCGSIQGEFSFLLPPGKYDLAVYSSSPDAHMPKPHERKEKDAPADMPPYLGGIRIDVPPQGGLDLGVLNVDLPKDKDGIARDYSQFYGKAPPELAITDAVGVGKAVKLEDFRGKWVLIDFWAVWCGPCRALAPTVEAIAERYSETATVVKLNVDDSPSTAESYGIRGIPTLILFSGGKEVERVIGAASKESIAAMIDRHIGQETTSCVA